MNETQWNACTDPQPMLEFLGAGASERKVRLFAVACCRQIWGLLPDESSRRAVELAERYADGEGGEAELSATWAAVRAAVRTATRSAGGPPGVVGALMAASEAADAVYQVAWKAARSAAYWAATAAFGAGTPGGRDAAEVRQAALARDVFGNPFRPGTLDPGWLPPPVVSLAQAAYQERDLPSGHLDPARLAVLADALEEAGCTDEAILGHLRGPGPHVRGCHILDLVLGEG